MDKQLRLHDLVIKSRLDQEQFISELNSKIIYVKIVKIIIQ